MRVLVADQQASVRYALSVLLKRNKGMDFVGEAVNMDALVEQIRQVKPDVVLLDWELPGMEGQPSLIKLRQLNTSLKIIGMSGLPGVRFAAISAGVNGFIHKTDPPDRLLRLLTSYAAEQQSAIN